MNSLKPDTNISCLKIRFFNLWCNCQMWQFQIVKLKKKIVIIPQEVLFKLYSSSIIGSCFFLLFFRLYHSLCYFFKLQHLNFLAWLLIWLQSLWQFFFQLFTSLLIIFLQYYFALCPQFSVLSFLQKVNCFLYCVMFVCITSRIFFHVLPLLLSICFC